MRHRHRHSIAGFGAAEQQLEAREARDALLSKTTRGGQQQQQPQQRQDQQNSSSNSSSCSNRAEGDCNTRIGLSPFQHYRTIQRRGTRSRAARRKPIISTLLNLASNCMGRCARGGGRPGALHQRFARPEPHSIAEPAESDGFVLALSLRLVLSAATAVDAIRNLARPSLLQIA